jgi:hypothetical protein
MDLKKKISLMADLKNYRAGVKTEEEGGKKGQEKKTTSDKLIYAHAAFSWKTR